MITGNKQKFSVKISTFTNNTLYIELYPIHCTDVTFTITVEVLLCNVTFQHEMKNEVLNPIKTMQQCLAESPFDCLLFLLLGIYMKVICYYTFVL